MSLTVIILALVTLQRVGELWLSNRNERRLLSRGAHEVGASHYFPIVAIHALWLLSLWLLAAPRPAHASTTFTVNIPGDTNTADNLCDVNLFGPGEQCTMRAAIQQSHATTGADAIDFGIPTPSERV